MKIKLKIKIRTKIMKMEIEIERLIYKNINLMRIWSSNVFQNKKYVIIVFLYFILYFCEKENLFFFYFHASKFFCICKLYFFLFIDNIINWIFYFFIFISRCEHNFMVKKLHMERRKRIFVTFIMNVFQSNFTWIAYFHENLHFNR